MNWVVVSVIIASTNGFRIENPQAGASFKTPGVSGGFFSSSQTPKPKTSSTSSFLNQPIAGYPKVPPPNAYEAGGHEDDLLPPFEDGGLGFSHLKSQKSFRRSVEEAEVDPKTGYPLVADPSWKNAGGNEESLELPLEDPKTSGGQEQEAVDPKTGYPLVAQAGWKYAGGDEAILELPLEDSESFDQGQEAVDPKTGYPLVAQPSWKFAGGDGEILQLPVEDEAQEKVDPKTGYPLVARPSWKDAGGNGEILELPFEDSADEGRVAVDPKTGYPLVAQPGWKDAGGDGDIIGLPLQDSDSQNDQEKVDPKTGYPLVAQPSWKEAGGNEDIIQLPLEESSENFLEERLGLALEEELLTELRPPPLENNYPTYSTFFFSPPTSFSGRSFQQNSGASVISSQNQRRSTGSQQQFGNQNKPVESSYTYTGPENVVVTVTRFLNTGKQERRQPQQPERQPLSQSKNGFTQFQNNVQQAPSTPPSLQSPFSSQNNGAGTRFQQSRQTTLFQPNNQNYSNFQTRNS